jgi:hypothetical protein
MKGLLDALVAHLVSRGKYSWPQGGRGRHVVHEHMKGGGGDGEAECHDQKFEMAMVRPERHLGDVVWVHQHLVVAAAKVELGEVAHPLELIQELIDERNWKLVFHGLGVEGTVVDAESPSMIFLADEQDGCREWRRAGPYDGLMEHVISLLLYLILQQLRVSVGSDSDRWHRRQQMDAMIKRSWWRQA